MVQVLSSTAIKQAKVTGENQDVVISKYLLTYRNTPHSTTGEAPAMLLMKRKLRTCLDLIRPSLQSYVENKQHSMEKSKTHRRLREFYVGDSVFVRNYGGGEKWLKGSIIEVHGSRHYIVNIHGRHLRRHVGKNYQDRRKDHF